MIELGYGLLLAAFLIAVATAAALLGADPDNFTPPKRDGCGCGHCRRFGDEPCSDFAEN